MSTPTEPSERPARLSVGVVGTGRVGSVLGAALARAGHRVVAATAVSDASRRRLERWLPGVPARPADEVVAAAELVLVTVPDDLLAGLVEGLAGTGAWQAGQLVVHASGAHGLAVLEPATRAGALPLALHPVLPFQDRDEDLDRLDGISWGVTAPEPLRLIAEALVVEMGGEPCWVADEYRPLYHAGLAIGANHLVTLVADAVDTLRAAGVEQPARMLAPLLYAALDNAFRHGDAALTGPVARGDAGTVASHRRVLAAAVPQAVPAYVAMARRTADRALAAGLLRPEQAEALLDVLGSTP
ncbi:MAG: Rossmann-like and DUF2520 domain-containing protein [Mycobacteriales bacterium]|jgi:predicted short-subunit dehydrogenase-like oxidoreductase (DUF2520 family)